MSDMQSAPVIQFAGDTVLVVNSRGQTIMLTPGEALAVLDWLQANEEAITIRQIQGRQS